MLLLREARSYINPTNRVSHTNKYTDHKKLAVVQTRMTSEKISGTGAPTIEQQASQMLHQDEGSVGGSKGSKPAVMRWPERVLP